MCHLCRYFSSAAIPYMYINVSYNAYCYVTLDTRWISRVAWPVAELTSNFWPTAMTLTWYVHILSYVNGFLTWYEWLMCHFVLLSYRPSFRTRPPTLSCLVQTNVAWVLRYAHTHTHTLTPRTHTHNMHCTPHIHTHTPKNKQSQWLACE